MQWETDFLRYLRNISSPFFDVFFQIITILGEQYVLILILALIYFCYDKKAGRIIAFSLFCSLLINNSVKGLVKCERPFVKNPDLDAVRKETATGYSFPSGHSQQAAAFYASVAGNVKFKRKKLLWSVCLVTTFLIGFSRLWLAVHYPKDVIVGLLLGFACAFGCPFLYRLCEGKQKKELLLFVAVLIIFFPFLFLFYKSSYEEIKLFRDFYLCYAMFAGFTAAFAVDNKYLSFSCRVSYGKKALRLAGAAAVFIAVKFGLDFLFDFIVPGGSVFLDFFRYFMVTFGVLGLYPLIFRKRLFSD